MEKKETSYIRWVSYALIIVILLYLGVPLMIKNFCASSDYHYILARYKHLSLMRHP